MTFAPGRGWRVDIAVAMTLPFSSIAWARNPLVPKSIESPFVMLCIYLLKPVLLGGLDHCLKIDCRGLWRNTAAGRKAVCSLFNALYHCLFDICRLSKQQDPVD